MGSQNSAIGKVIDEGASLYLSSFLLPDIDPKFSLYCKGGVLPVRKYKHKDPQTIQCITRPIFYHNSQLDLEGNMEKKRIEETKVFPWSAHGIILTKLKGTTYWSSGTLITNTIVLTAAQNIYSREHKTYAESIRFFPAVNGQILPFGEAKVEEYFVPQEYVDSGAENYALLMLQTPIAEITGSLGLRVVDANFALAQTLAVTGYSSYNTENEVPVYEMWQIKGKTDSETQGVLSYQVISSPGSAVHESSDKPFTIGVHIQGKDGENGVTLITKSRYDRMQKWVHESMERKLGGNKADYVKDIDLLYKGINESGLKSLATYQLRDLRRISAMRCELGDKEIRALATNTTWTNLEELVLSDNRIKAAGAEFLASNTSWVKLKRLDLSVNQLGSLGAQALAKNTSWANLKQLHLYKNKIGDLGVEALATNTSWVNLKELQLSDNQIGSSGAQALAMNTSWINLKHLLIGNNQIGDIGIEAFVKNTSWLSLKGLDLTCNQIGDIAVEYLTKSEKCRDLRSLYLRDNHIGPGGIEILAKSNSWPKLENLSLGENKVGDIGAAALANTNWANLTFLDLDNTEIEQIGAEMLGKNTSWINLAQLQLENNDLGDIGVGELAKNVSWVNLVWLHLPDVNMTSVGAQALAQNQSWKQLRTLILDYNEIEEDGRIALWNNWPQTHIAYDFYY